MRLHIITALILFFGTAFGGGCHRVEWSETRAMARSVEGSQPERDPSLPPDIQTRGLCDSAIATRVAHLLEQPPRPPLVASRDALKMRGSYDDWCVFLRGGEAVAWVTVLPDPKGDAFRDLASTVDFHGSRADITTLAGLPALDLQDHGVVVSEDRALWSFTVHHTTDDSPLSPHDREREFAMEILDAVSAR